MARSSRLAIATLVLVTLVAPPAGSQAACPTTPTYDSRITRPETALPLWPFRRATAAEIVSYVRTVDGQSQRVSAAQYSTSWQGRPLLYALVGTPENVAAVDQIAARQQALRDPRTTRPAEAEQIVADSPAIVWYSGNVHGLETSGADAALRILYELASRTDCEVEGMLRELVIGIIPTQNPDGREAAARTNAYGFDMNRDWFARTQPEIDDEVSLLRRYPPVLFIDAHEMGSSDFFFPPNDDPIHHEVSQESLHWINDLYGPALRAAFEQRQSSDPLNWDYFNYQTYDLFFMGYGDTAPTTGFTAAGMTFEKGTADPDHVKEREQFVAGWTSLKVAADNKDSILREYYRAHVDALAQGRAGVLEKNVIVVPGNEMRTDVPNLTIRHYFIRPTPAQPEAYHLIQRLMDMDVEVYRLRRRVRVPDLQRYGADPSRTRLQKGTFWIPMGQPQKHWIQALLGEDPYGSLVYFYDVSAWSNPLLMDVDASFSGAKLRRLSRSAVVKPSGKKGGKGDRDRNAPRRKRKRLARQLVQPPGGRLLNVRRARSYWFAGDTARAVAGALELARQGVGVRRLESGGGKRPAGAFVVPRGGQVRGALREIAGRYRLLIRGSRGRPAGFSFTQPKIAVYNAPDGGESLGHLRYTLDQVWRLPYTLLSPAEVQAGRLTADRYDVFLVPGVNATPLEPAEPQIRSWIQSGGIYVGTARGTSGGTPYAIANGFTSSSQSNPPGYLVPGTLFRMEVAGGSPATLGADGTTYWFNRGDRRLAPSTTGLNPVRYPASEPAFWLSGYAAGHQPLQGSAGLVEERMGAGRVVLFSGEPNYRSYTEGSAFFLANALAAPTALGLAGRTVDVTSPRAREDVLVAQARTEPVGPGGLPIVIEVARAQEAAAVDILERFARTVEVERARGSSFLSIPNPRDLEVDEHPFASRLLPALKDAGITPRSAAL